MLKENILSAAEIDTIILQYSISNAKRFNTRMEIGTHIAQNGYDFSNCVFNCDTIFSGAPFNAPVNFSNSIFVGDANFRGAHFNQDTVNFFNVVFYEEGNFQDSIIDNNVNFRNATFKKVANFRNANFTGSSDFRHVNFHFEALFDVKNKNTKSAYHPFTVMFNESIFHKKAIFYSRIFNEVTFSNTSFKALCDFWNSDFNVDTCFDKTDFLGACVFADTVFEKKAIFLYTQVSKNMILRNAQFRGGVNLALINFIGEGYINTLEVFIKEFVPYKGTTNNDYDFLSENISSRHKRESFRILKHEALKQNNKIEALTFHAKEMESYRQELKSESKKWKLFIWVNKIWSIISVFFKELRLSERLILFLNKYSNNHGLSWWRGVLFTFLVGSFFFSIYTPTLLGYRFDFSFHGMKTWLSLFKTYIEYFPAIFNPTHSFDFMKDVSNNNLGWALVVDFLGRIAVGFGIYQTVQAFRKYGRS